MSERNEFSASENQVMEMTMKASFKRAADIIDKITKDDVLDMQARLLGEGKTIEQVSIIDRAHLASAHFRAIASGEFMK